MVFRKRFKSSCSSWHPSCSSLETMSRSGFTRTRLFPYHVTVQSNNQEWFHISKPVLWEIFLCNCLMVKEEFSIRFHAFVLMSNHFHFLLSTPLANLDQAMECFLHETSRSVYRSGGRIDDIFGGPYLSSLITSSVYFRHAFKYIYRNPVEARICSRVQDYAYSSIHDYLGRGQRPFPLSMCRIGDDLLRWGRPDAVLDWLNVPCSDGMVDCVYLGL